HASPRGAPSRRSRRPAGSRGPRPAWELPRYLREPVPGRDATRPGGGEGSPSQCGRLVYETSCRSDRQEERLGPEGGSGLLAVAGRRVQRRCGKRAIKTRGTGRAARRIAAVLAVGVGRVVGLVGLFELRRHLVAALEDSLLL